MTERIMDRLRTFASRRAVLLGIGNVLRGDDGFGPELAAIAASRGLMPAIDAGTTPENQVGAVARMRPELVILADAVHMERTPGWLDLLTARDLEACSSAGTHALSPGMVMERIAVETGAEVLMLAVQPGNLGFGEPLSPEVGSALETAAEILGGLFSPGASLRGLS